MGSATSRQGSAPPAAAPGSGGSRLITSHSCVHSISSPYPRLFPAPSRHPRRGAPQLAGASAAGPEKVKPFVFPPPATSITFRGVVQSSSK